MDFSLQEQVALAFLYKEELSKLVDAVTLDTSEEFEKILSSVRAEDAALYCRLACLNIPDLDKFKSVVLTNVDAFLVHLELGSVVESKLLPQCLVSQTGEVWKKKHLEDVAASFVAKSGFGNKFMDDSWSRTVEKDRRVMLESNVSRMTSYLEKIQQDRKAVVSNYGIGGSVETLKLRPYQEELAMRPLRGENTIICAPTGSGKTWVSVKIIMEHLKNTANPRVAFLVPTVPLVEQQEGVLKLYLRDRWRIGGICGGETDVNKAEHIFCNHVTVMTPQILLNALQDPVEERQLSLTQFTLLVFDECHHCDQKHPYNDTMAVCHDMKFGGKVPEGESLPQIVGLTASLGVGTSDSRQRAVDHVIRMAANMGAHALSVVRKEERSLEEFVHIPKDELIQVRASYKHSPFTIYVGDFMKTVEANVTSLLETLRRNGLATKLQGVPFTPKAERFSVAYQGWIDQLLNSVPLLHDKEAVEQLYPYLQFLRICHCALDLNAHVPVKQAVNYLAREMANFSGTTDADLYCSELFNRRFESLTNLANSRQPLRNEIAERLCEELRKHYAQQQDSRTIVFVKTRELTRELKYFLSEDGDLAQLNPEQLTSVNTSTEKDGQSLTEQQRVLTDFRSGKCKLVVATSVAEEGLDVAKCSLIIKYNHVSNEIALAQRRGRGRAEGSRSILLAQEGSVADREMTNMLKEKLMRVSLQIIRDAGPNWFRNEVEKKAKKFYDDRQLEKAILVKQRRHLGDKKFDISCKKCGSEICDSDGIRTVQNHHFVCADPNIWAKCNARPLDAAKVQYQVSVAGKLSCGNCNVDLGNIIKYSSVFLPNLKADCLAFTEKLNSANKMLAKKWKKVTTEMFVVDTISRDDLRTMVRRLKESVESTMNQRVQEGLELKVQQEKERKQDQDESTEREQTVEEGADDE